MVESPIDISALLAAVEVARAAQDLHEEDPQSPELEGMARSTAQAAAKMILESAGLSVEFPSQNRRD